MPHAIKDYFQSSNAEVVISGISGTFPNANNINEFSTKIYNKVDLIDGSKAHWTQTYPDVPKRMGTVDALEKFDRTFFSINAKQTHMNDPQFRILIEKSYEAVADAGINPETLKFTNTGVFAGIGHIETDVQYMYGPVSEGGHAIMGASRSLLANRISYSLGLQGPSLICETGCSSSMSALDNAYQAIKTGQCDAALVVGSNILLHPGIAMQYFRLGLLSENGECRCFDNDASGFARSEAFCAIFLQKHQDARRIYATVVHSKQNHDGYKSEGIVYPSTVGKQKLLDSFYNEIDVSPSIISYVEANANGNFIGDAEEYKMLKNVFCLADRKKPLIIGAVKSVVGECESVSGLVAITKAILALEKGFISPNIHFNQLNRNIVMGNIKICTDIQKLDGPFIGVNNFGFGGSNVHVLLRGPLIENRNQYNLSENIPRLVNWAGRTHDGVQQSLNDIQLNAFNQEFIGLIHSVQNTVSPQLLFRGYGLYEMQATTGTVTRTSQEIHNYSGIKRPIVFVFSGMGSQWNEMGTQLLQLPIFRESIQRSHDILIKLGLDLINIITTKNTNIFDNVLNSFVGIASIQIALIDIFKLLNVQPDFIIGHSIGELGCAYADDCITAEQMILIAYSRGISILEANIKDGAIAAIGLQFKKIIDLLPQEIDVACHNSIDSSTISGPADKVTEFVKKLQERNIFARIVNSSNIPFHSRYMQAAGARLLTRLKEIIPVPKQRSPKWICTSAPKNQWTDKNTIFNCPEYHVNNLLSTVLFEEGLEMLPENAITIEFAPHGLLQSLLKQSMPNAIHIPITKRSKDSNNLAYFLSAIGRLFTNGLEIPIERLYPEVKYPVSRGTPFISPHIHWDHSENWNVPKYGQKQNSCERMHELNINQSEYSFCKEYVLSGKIVFPIAALLKHVWEIFAEINELNYEKINVEFEGVKIWKLIVIQNESSISKLITMIHSGTGKFEITMDSELIISGIIHTLTSTVNRYPIEQNNPGSENILSKEIVYKELNQRGYHFLKNGTYFQVIDTINSACDMATIRWNSNWISAIDGMFQAYFLASDASSGVHVPRFIQSVKIKPVLHITNLSETDQCFNVWINSHLNAIISDGIEIYGLESEAILMRDLQPIEKLSQPVRNIIEPVKDEYYYVKLHEIGNLLSINWSKGEVIPENSVNQLIRIYYFSFNQRDIKLADGDISLGDEQIKGFNAKHPLGVEYSGIRPNGEKVMGITPCGAMSTHLLPIKHLIWKVPNNWTLKDAANSLIQYITIYYAFFIKANVSKGKSILFNYCKCDTITLAGIEIALAYGLHVIVTVDKMETERNYLLNKFPQLQTENILDRSRISTIGKMVRKCTNGKGVNYVLNTMEELRYQSLRFIDICGTYFEIATYSSKEIIVGIRSLVKEISYQTIFIENLFNYSDEVREQLWHLIDKDLNGNVIKPLLVDTFDADKLPEIIRNFQENKDQLRKVVIQIRNNIDDKFNMNVAVNVICEAYFNPNNQYIVNGELNELTIKFIQWMINRKARRFILYKSDNPLDVFQKYKIRQWENLGCSIDLYHGCILKEFKESKKFENLSGIFLFLKTAECSKNIIVNITSKLSKEILKNCKYFMIFIKNPDRKNLDILKSIQTQFPNTKFAELNKIQQFTDSQLNDLFVSI